MDIGAPNTPQIWYATLYTQEPSETQLHTVRVSGASQPKRWVSLGFWSMWRVWRQLRFSMILRFWWHPFNPTYDAMSSFS